MTNQLVYFIFQASLAQAAQMSWFMQWGLYETISALESTPFVTRTGMLTKSKFILCRLSNYNKGKLENLHF